MKGRRWRRLGARLYCGADLALDGSMLIAAWRRMLPDTAVFVGRTAAWLHGVGLDFVNPVEVAVPTRCELRSRAGLDVRRCDIDRGEVTTVRGSRLTTLPRTLLDLCARRPAVEALVVLNIAVRKRLHWNAGDFKGRPGAKRLRTLTAQAAPAESPMETRLRWLLTSSGLPAPDVQADLLDAAGRLVGRADLFYANARLVVEFDGGNHRERLVTDDRRHNLLTGAGYRLLRFTAADVYQRPDVVVAQVRGALATPGLSGPA